MKQFLLLCFLFLPLSAAAQWEVRMNGLPVSSAYQNVALADSTTAWIAGGVNLWHTTNLGRDWTLASFPRAAGHPSIMSAISHDTLVYGTDAGKIVRTTDGGAHWAVTFADSSVTVFVNDLMMFDSLHGFCMGDPPDTAKHPGLLKTSDGGASWQVVENDLPLGDYQSRDRTSFIRPEVGWTKVWNDGIYKTTNGGLNWTRIYSPHNPVTIFFLDDSVGFSMSFDALGLFRTTDGGVSWTQTIFDARIYWVRWAPGGKRLWAGADSVFMSTDGGEHWEVVLSNKTFGTSSTFQDARFFRDNIGLVAGIDIVLAMEPPLAPELVSPPNRVYVFGPPMFSWHPFDGATRYHLQSSTDSLFRTNFLVSDSTLTDTTRWSYPIDSSFYWSSDSLYWRVRAFKVEGWTPWSDRWMFIISGDGVLEDGGLPTAYSLEQNYPNPFNPLTTIKFTLGGAGPGPSGRDSRSGGPEGRGSGVSKTMLMVYDVIGRQVASLVDEVKAPGSYEVQFDGSSLASGVYIYRLTTGSFVQTRKMILLR